QPAPEVLAERVAPDHGIEQHGRTDQMLAVGAAGLHDAAGDVAAGDVRQRERHAGHASADEDVEVVQRTGEDADEDLVFAGLTALDLGVLERFRPAVLAQDGGPHRRGAGDPHGDSSATSSAACCCRSLRSSLFVPVTGSVSTKKTRRGWAYAGPRSKKNCFSSSSPSPAARETTHATGAEPLTRCGA